MGWVSTCVRRDLITRVAASEDESVTVTATVRAACWMIGATSAAVRGACCQVLTAGVVPVLGRVEADQRVNVRDEPGLQFNDFDETDPHRIRVGAAGASSLGAVCVAG